MRLVVFGLSVSSAWGNGHATLWRSLVRALDDAGHAVTFFEKDVPYYASHRDVYKLPGRSRLRLYASWDEVAGEAERAVREADAAMVTSYCPDGRVASELVLASSRGARLFYDMDTPVTLARLEAGEDVSYLPRQGLAGFDRVLSFTGGRALDLLRERLGGRRVAPLYGSVDMDTHRPVAPSPEYEGVCSYLGTWSADRQKVLETLFLEPARRYPDTRFVLGGAMYPADLAWPSNVAHLPHVAPDVHPRFYCSSPVTVNVTRGPMAAVGYCPSGRLFEAAACGVPVLSDTWAGLETFYEPGREILVARTTDEACAALFGDRDELARIGARARARTRAEHSGTQRARELVDLIETSHDTPSRLAVSATGGAA